jgi:hypothetical protein
MHDFTYLQLCKYISMFWSNVPHLFTLKKDTQQVIAKCSQLAK